MGESEGGREENTHVIGGGILQWKEGIRKRATRGSWKVGHLRSDRPCRHICRNIIRIKTVFSLLSSLPPPKPLPSLPPCRRIRRHVSRRDRQRQRPGHSRPGKCGRSTTRPKQKSHQNKINLTDGRTKELNGRTKW